MSSEMQTTELRLLLDRIHAGDQAALGELLRRSAGRMERLARLMLRRFPQVRGQEQTGDVVQMATISLLSALRLMSFRSTREYYGLAAEHIRRRLLDLARGARRRGREHRPLDEVPEVCDAAERDLDLWQDLQEAVEKLPADQREVFSLRFYHGWDHGQIAELLQVSTKTVGRAWLRAQLRLGELLGGRGVPGGEVGSGHE